jgi:hypothetical protein
MTIAAAKGIARRIEAIENRLGGVRVFFVSEGDPEPPEDNYPGLTVISQSRQRRGSQGRRHEKQNSA